MGVAALSAAVAGGHASGGVTCGGGQSAAAFRVAALDCRSLPLQVGVR